MEFILVYFVVIFICHKILVTRMKKNEEIIAYVLRKDGKNPSELLPRVFNDSRKGTDELQVASYIIALGATASKYFDLTTLSSIFDVVMIINLIFMVFLVLLFELLYILYK